MKNKLLPAILITVSVVLFSCGGDPVELKLNLSKGDSYACKVDLNQKINTTAMGMKMNIDQKIEIYQTLKVDEANADGSYALTYITDRFYMKQSMPMMGMPVDVEFDTDKPEKASPMGESMGPYFKKMKGLSYQVSMDSQGKILSNNLSEVYEKLGLDTLSEQGGNTNSSSSNAEQYSAQLPEKPIKKGDKYVIDASQTEANPLATKNTYTVKEITDEKVLLEVKSEFLPAAEANDLKMEIKGSQEGTVEIDRKTGMTVRSEIKQNIDMTIHANGMSMPMKTEGTIIFTCEKK